MANSFILKNLPVRSYLLADKSPFGSLFENALEKTRQLLRVFQGKKGKLSTESFRADYKPLERFGVHTGPTLSPKSKLDFLYSGFINKVTSKWVSESIAGLRSKEVRRFFQTGGPMLGLVGFGLTKKPSLLTDEEELEGVSYFIRDSFSYVPWYGKGLKIKYEFINRTYSLEDIKFGDMIAKGCNAAVYSARFVNSSIVYPSEVKNSEIPSASVHYEITKVDTNSMKAPEEDVDEIKNGENETENRNEKLCSETKLIISHSEGETDSNSGVISCDTSNNQLQIKDFGDYDLAVKIMFNYSAESNAFAIWNAMHKETLPVLADFNWEDMGHHGVRKKRLKPHPNIIQMYFAFADQIPLLPGALNDYPQALPVRLLQDGCGRNMTLFLAMKRYHCSLVSYLKSQKPSPQVALILFTQLLEALVYLHQNGIAHRDLKSDNILIDLSEGINSPKLAITDFGCCLESLQLKYTSYDISKGGNMALMAPEVVKAEPGQFSVIDYNKSDLWTVGTIAYEIFGAANPFYSSSSFMKSKSYDENKLPFLPETAYPVIQKLVKDILHVNPKKRPSQSFSATVCQILLHAPADLRMKLPSEDLSKRALEWMMLMSAETFLEASMHKTLPSNVEFELRHTFCTRIQYLEVIQALEYIQNT